MSAGFWQRHLDKIGVGGSLFAALCCLGYPAVLAIVSAIGLGFLLRDAVLIPMLVAFLALTLFGLYRGQQGHGRWHAAGAVVVFASVLLGNALAASIGIALLIAASLLNVRLAA